MAGFFLMKLDTSPLKPKSDFSWNIDQKKYIDHTISTQIKSIMKLQPSQEICKI